MTLQRFMIWSGFTGRSQPLGDDSPLEADRKCAKWCSGSYVGVLLGALLLAGCGGSDTAEIPPETAISDGDSVESPLASGDLGDEATVDSLSPDTMQEVSDRSTIEGTGPGSDAAVNNQTSGGDGALLTPPPENADPGGDANPDDLFQAAIDKSPAEKKAAKAFAEPAGATRLDPEANIWVDREKRRVILDGYVALPDGPLEMFACPVGTKEHEAVVAVLSASKLVHAGLLAVGAVQGTPVEFVPEYRPATGQRIAIWVVWKTADGEIKKNKAQEWVKKSGTDEALTLDWVFAGSSFWKDPQDGREYYQADSGDLICVSNFATATLDLPIESSGTNSALLFSAFDGRVPERGTPVRLVLSPIPLPGEAAEGQVDPETPPEDELVAPGAATEGE